MNHAGEKKVHVLPATPETVHTGFYDHSLPPVLSIHSGDTVLFETMHLYDDRVEKGLTFKKLGKLKQTYVDRKVGPHTLTGPVYVSGAKAGDVLEIKIKRITPRTYGFNVIYPGTGGTLPEDFPEGRIKEFDLDWENKQTTFAPGIVIPLRPFLGSMGVAPKEPGRSHSGPPMPFGGNIDCKELVEGTILFLPVQVQGALFSCGDAHAAQGDGEVCLTALETALTEAKLQFVVRKDMNLEVPRFETPTHWGTMGFSEDLHEAVKIALKGMIKFLASEKEMDPYEAVKIALKGMITFLASEKEMDPYEAYSLCSLQADLRVTQVVDGNKGIHAMMPKSIFKSP